jgi:hypothetical protein
MRCDPADDSSRFLYSYLVFLRPQDLEGTLEVGVDAHHGSGVVKLAAIVGRREDGHQTAVAAELIAVLNHLVGPADEVQAVFVEEYFEDIATERV